MRIPSPEASGSKSQETLQDLENGAPLKYKEIEGQRVEIEDLVERQKAIIEAKSEEIHKLRASRDRYVERCRDASEKVIKLQDNIEAISTTYQQALNEREQRIRAVEHELKQTKAFLVTRSADLAQTQTSLSAKSAELTQTKALLAARSAEFSGAQSFLSTADRLSEAEVLGIVRDLNENIFQVAANLTEEWEKFRKSDYSCRTPITDKDIEPLSQMFGPALVQGTRRRRSAALTFLVQSCLCDAVAQLATRWQHDSKLRILGNIHQQLSATEGQAISARWRSLTHGYLPQPLSHSGPVAELVARTLWITGLFYSKQDSIKFVKGAVYNRIEAIERLAVRLESVFMADVTSSDMSLLLVTPLTVFDGTRMIEECESGKNSTPRGQEKVVGITEVGIEKSTGRRGEPRHTEVLLKAKVVLEKDLADL